MSSSSSSGNARSARGAWYPNWVRSEATRYAWEHDATWRADALANGSDGAQRLRLLNAAVAIFATRPPDTAAES